MSPSNKLVLAVIDGLKPAMLERAVAEGLAPTLGLLMELGVYVDDCVAAFPSVTPVCTASIATGTGPDEHGIPSMNWYDRGDERYVEYGSSFSASRAFGIHRSLTDTIYNLNMAHLSRATPTLFEELDDAGLRTAGTTFLIYRGRYRHEAADESALARLVTATLFRHAVWGPRELFYADIFSSRRTGCRAQLGLPGARDQHTGCVGAYMVEHDLFDFMLFSLPDNDTLSHKGGPEAQVAAIAAADRQLARLMAPAGGPEEFLEDHAMIVMADHSHELVEQRIDLADSLSRWSVLLPSDASPLEAELAVCPAQRSAMVYVLDLDRREELIRLVADAATKFEGVDLVMLLDAEQAVIRAGGAELRFAPGDDVRDVRGQGWRIEGDLAVLEAELRDGVIGAGSYPDALARTWSSLHCPGAGDVLLSAQPGWEFTDWGGADHIGGGSHGSLHASDSLGALIFCGTGPSEDEQPAQWAIRDIAGVVREHFGLATLT